MKVKERSTVLHCSNADGTEKCKHMFIGTSAKPRPFKKKSGTELGREYYTNKKAWMSRKFFFHSLHRLEANIAKTSGGIAPLIINSSSALGNCNNILSLSIVVVVFLTPNTTFKIQTLNASIITALAVQDRF